MVPLMVLVNSIEWLSENLIANLESISFARLSCMGLECVLLNLAESWNEFVMFLFVSIPMIVARLSCAMMEVVLSVVVLCTVQYNCRLVTFSGIEFCTGVDAYFGRCVNAYCFGRWTVKGCLFRWVTQNG